MSADQRGSIDERVAEALARATGWAFPEARRSQLETGIGRTIRALGLSGADELILRLASGDRPVVDTLVAELAVGETYFFRDPPHTQLLERHILPSVSHGPPIRIWSAGCATGEEAYSIAMTALSGPRWSVEIIGTDINPAFLERAREARYGTWSFRSVPEQVRSRWFIAQGKQWELVEEARRVVKFGRLNLCDEIGAGWPQEQDAIFCRNVLIYFDAATSRSVTEKLIRCLRPGGWLVVGPSDPLFLDIPGVEPIEISRYLPEYAPSAGYLGYRIPAPDELPAERPVAPTAPRPIAALQRTEPSAPNLERDGSDDLARARALADAGDLRESKTILDALIGSAAPSSGAYVLRATLRADEGDYGGALVDARAALMLDRSLVIAYVIRAMAHLELGDTSQAERALRTAQELMTRATDEDEVVPHSGGETVARMRATCAKLGKLLLRDDDKGTP